MPLQRLCMVIKSQDVCYATNLISLYQFIFVCLSHNALKRHLTKIEFDNIDKIPHVITISCHHSHIDFSLYTHYNNFWILSALFVVNWITYDNSSDDFKKIWPHLVSLSQIKFNFWSNCKHTICNYVEYFTENQINKTKCMQKAAGTEWDFTNAIFQQLLHINVCKFEMCLEHVFIYTLLQNYSY